MSNTHMSQATLMKHIDVIAQGKHQQSQFHCFQDTQRCLLSLGSINQVLEQQSRDPIYTDKAHAGAILPALHGFQSRRDDLKYKLKTTHQDLEKACLKTKEIMQATLLMDKQIAALKRERDEACEARNIAHGGQDKAEAAVQQLTDGWMDGWMDESGL